MLHCDPTQTRIKLFDVVRVFGFGLVIFSIISFPRCSRASNYANVFTEHYVEEEQISADWDKCFCSSQSVVDDCSCTIESVDHFSNEKFHPLLQKILGSAYFRYFKANLYRQCPFWKDEGVCSSKDCFVRTCSTQELPDMLRDVERAKQLLADSRSGSEPDECEDIHDLGDVESMSAQKTEEISEWSDREDDKMEFCVPDDESCPHAEYYDLKQNPERYTGYRGQSAHNIWKSIYQENCFQDDAVRLQEGVNKFLNAKDVENMCLEKRVFYRLISGLHASISVHLSANYLYPGKTWKPNVLEFQRRFDSKVTGGEGPYRLRNLYFAFLVELRALQKVSHSLRFEKYFTGNEVNDDEVKSMISQLMDTVDNFPYHFNESLVLLNGDKDLLEEFRMHFKNISRIMDCVGCVKCRLWGKLQIQGMGTALKILFNDEASLKTALRRNEIISLFNAIGRLASSIAHIHEFRSLIAQNEDDQSIVVARGKEATIAPNGEL